MFRSLRHRNPIGFLKKSSRLKVTFNGPFVEYPKCHTSTALNGEIHFDVPQSGSICIKPHSLACIEGSVETLTAQSSFMNGVVYSKLVLKTASQIIADQGSIENIKAVQIDAPKKWQVNGLGKIFSWSSVSFDLSNDLSLVGVEGAGFFSLSGDYTVLELSKEETIALPRLKFIATNGSVLKSELSMQTSNSLLAYTVSQVSSWYEIIIKPILDRLPIRNQFSGKTEVTIDNNVSESIPTDKLTNHSDIIKVTGPGLLIINNA